MVTRWQWLDRLLGRDEPDPLASRMPTTSQHRAVLASPTFETHIGPINIEEASKRSSKAKGPQNLSMAWDDTYTGVSGVLTREGLLSERDKKDTYYKAYIGNPWVRSSVNVIGKRFTSGGWEVEPMETGVGNEADRDKIKALLLFINSDEDFKQHLRSISDDLNIFGEAYDEIVPGADGLPAQLHKIDCTTMTPHYDKHGMVVGYTQSLEKSNDVVEFTPEQIIRWWFPDPRASKKALSPIECCKDAVYLYQAQTTWAEKFFKQSARPAFSIEMGEDSNDDDARRYVKFFKENYMGIQNAHVPPVFYGGSKLVEFGKGSVDMDFLKGRDACRDEILAVYNVPLSLIGIQETAHLGGGSGDSANKAFVYNTVKPIEEMILEKFNYRVIQEGFGIYDWVVTVRHADYRDDSEITKIQDTQIRNGSLTVNEARQERGRVPIDGGDTAVVVASRDIIPVERLAEMAEEQRQQAQLSIVGAKAAMQQAQQAPDDGSKPGDENADQPPSEKGKDQQPSEKKAKEHATQQVDQASRSARDQASPHKTSRKSAYEAFYYTPPGAFAQTPYPAQIASQAAQKSASPLEAAAPYQTAKASQAWSPQKVEHWQDTDKAVLQSLADMTAKGMKTLTWKAYRGSCDECLMNDGQTVKIGERFKSGAYLPPNHGNCACGWVDDQGKLYQWLGVDGMYEIVK